MPCTTPPSWISTIHAKLRAIMLVQKGTSTTVTMTARVVGLASVIM